MVKRFNVYTLSLVEEKENIVEVILKNNGKEKFKLSNIKSKNQKYTDPQQNK